MIASNEYAGTVGFTVRKENTGSAIELLGGITSLGGGSSNETDVLYEYIGSQQMVRAVHSKIDLHEVYHNPGDPVFGIGNDRRIEALTDYWQRMVRIKYDRSTGLTEVEVRAFDPTDAQRIAQAIYDEATDKINELSAIARSDTTRYAREELDHAMARLKTARAALTEFRSRTQIVDPAADIQGRMGLLNTLQQQLAAALIELDLLRENTAARDPRVVLAEQKAAVIRQRIAAERDQFGSAETTDPEAFSNLVSEYESLSVDLQYAEQTYLAAATALDAAEAEAQRKSLYLANYIEPTLAETPEYPKRLTILATVSVFLFLTWSILAMVYYSVRDRQ